jgi:Rad3-related DNA helicase
MYKGNLIDFFPVTEYITGPRSNQTAVMNEVDKVIKEGKKKIILIEGPVGCGKSAMAITLARAFEQAHVITPRKSLQDQYYEDFKDHIVLMKGRGAYPCTISDSRAKYVKVVRDIKDGRVNAPRIDEMNCGSAPCRNSPDTYNACVNDKGPCPYTIAMETAQDNGIVIHNLHSFIFQTNFANKFEQRKLLIVDEAHEIEGIVREFISKKITINRTVSKEKQPEDNDVEKWCDFLLTPEFVPMETMADQINKQKDKNYQSSRDQYIAKIQLLRAQQEFYKDKYIIRSTYNRVGERIISTSFEFIPEKLGNAATDLILNKGEYVVLMSGTIYGKDVFCKNLGINPEEAHYIRIPSTFPAKNRPIIAKPEYQVDTSFANWNENFEEMLGKIGKVMDIFHDAKGLIHAPSYEAAEQIVSRMGGRLMTHGKGDMQEKLQMFYDSDEPLVFVSPVCQQGVDFKGDRARFQIILRVPYANTSDAFVNHKVQTDFQWYNYQALVVWGQQIGRVNRSEDDYGATFLMDSRFNKFIQRNSGKIPKWVQSAIIWK